MVIHLRGGDDHRPVPERKARVGHIVEINNYVHHSDGSATRPTAAFFVVPYYFVSLRRSRAAGIHGP